MHRRSFALGPLVVALLATAVAPGTGLASGQEQDQPGPEAPQGYDQRVDEWVTLTDWRYDSEQHRFLLTFESERTVRVTIAEVVSRQEGDSGRFSVQQHTVENGTTTVELLADPGPSGEAAVTITTARSLQQGRGVFVSTGQDASGRTSPFAETSSTAGWLGGVSLVLVTLVIVVWRRMTQEPEAPREAI